MTLDGRELHGKPFMAYNLNVGQAFTLTAGTNLVFYEGSLNVLSGARLTLDGSPTEPVTLTSAALDDWKGVKLNSGTSARLSYCDISNSGGSGSNGTIEVVTSDVLIDHCTIHNTSPGYGAILINAAGISPTIQHTTIRDNSNVRHPPDPPQTWRRSTAT